MVQEAVYSPHSSFFANKMTRDKPYEMGFFHFHKKHELYYLSEGSRKYFIGDSTYLVNAGDLVVIPPDQIHKTGGVDENGHTRYVINFNEETIYPNFYLEQEALFAAFSTPVRVVRVPMRSRTLIESLFRRLCENYPEADEAAVMKRKILLSELLMYVNEFISNQSVDDADYGRVQNKLIEDIQKYISVHYRENLSLSEIATQFFISPSYLSRLFKRVTNLSIVEYTNGVRIMAAKTLLEKSDMKVSELAESVGFSTTVHFNRLFKEGTGFSPHQYRKTYQTNRKK